VLIAFVVNASDPLNAPLTYTVQNLPAGAFDANTHQFQWTPTFTQAGGYDVTFKADNGVNFALCAVHLQITDRVPGAPSINCPGQKQVAERVDLGFNVTATDPNGLPVTFSLISPRGCDHHARGRVPLAAHLDAGRQLHAAHPGGEPAELESLRRPRHRDRPAVHAAGLACPGNQVTAELH
jgi:hypothetical protein